MKKKLLIFFLLFCSFISICSDSYAANTMKTSRKSLPRPEALDRLLDFLNQPAPELITIEGDVDDRPLFFHYEENLKNFISAGLHIRWPSARWIEVCKRKCVPSRKSYKIF